MIKGGDLVNQTLDLVAENDFEAKPQSLPEEGKMAPKLDNKNTRIDWSKSPEEIYNLVRGLNPYPVAWTYFENGDKKMRCKIFAVRPEKIAHQYSAGEIFKTRRDLKVAVDGGYIYMLEMQMPGKRKMPIQDVLNGLQLEERSLMS